MMILASVAMSMVMICNRPTMMQVEMNGQKQTYRVLKFNDDGVKQPGWHFYSWELDWDEKTKQFYDNVVDEMNRNGKDIQFLHLGGKGQCSSA